MQINGDRNRKKILTQSWKLSIANFMQTIFLSQKNMQSLVVYRASDSYRS